ncbi:MAG: TetR/AcrR family transcriptional regulator, partial [Acidimicrobiia bacterium]|nr:TetR/AcrR family transcriptional regulator [Acidimicrobiia bacterium]
MSARLTATARREQLLDVALEVFAKAGYHDTSMNDIAEAAGVTKPVLYQHFESKRELYQALLDEVGARLLKAISAATSAATSGRQQTEQGFRAYFRWVADDHDAFTLLYAGGSRRDEDFASAVRRVTAGAAQAIA